MSHLAAFLPRRLKPWVWARISALLNLDYRLPSGYHARIRSYSDWCIYNDIFVAGEYDMAIRAALKKAPYTGTFRVVDLGANVGFFSLRILDLIRREKIPVAKVNLLLVEASPHLDRELRDRLSSASQGGVEIRIVHGLVGERSGNGQLEIANSEIKNAVVEHSSQNSLAVDYVDLETLLGPADHIDLLKCDIEGSEAAFLKNYPALLARTEVTVFEFHDPACPMAAGVAEVMKAGFARHEVLLDQGNLQTVLFQR
ncbi:MAG: FkbM family methyltransferase [Chthoniobacteraceae bacterium]